MIATERPSLAEARARVLALCRPGASVRIALEEAAGRALAETIVAENDVVPFARSAMDGYAARAIDLVSAAAAANTILPVGDAVFAERGRARLTPGTVAPIATGAPLPDGADVVVPIEATRRDARGVAIEGAFRPGDHVFPAGDDARAGETLARAGDRLTPATLALLAASGRARLAVRARPRVAVLTTGSEIVAVDETPAHGQIRNSNRVLVLATLRAAGAEIVRLAHVRDDPAALRHELVAALEAADLVVTTGGASVGTRDLVKSTLAELGVGFAFLSVALRPAKPAGFGSRGDTLVATLPGNPAAAFVALHELVVPAVEALAGLREPGPPRVRARLTAALHGKGERTFAAFCSLAVGPDGLLEATPLEDQCSSLTRIAARAAGLALVPPGAAMHGAGSTIDVDVIDWSRLTARGT